MTTTDTTIYPFVATVHRPDLPDIHLGFDSGHSAEHAATSLRFDLTSTQHVEGTTISYSPTPEGVTPLAPVPADPYTVAEFLAKEDDNRPYGHAFPDLFSRLKAQFGHEKACRIHSEAARIADEPLQMRATWDNGRATAQQAVTAMRTRIEEIGALRRWLTDPTSFPLLPSTDYDWYEEGAVPELPVTPETMAQMLGMVASALEVSASRYAEADNALAAAVTELGNPAPSN